MVLGGDIFPPDVDGVDSTSWADVLFDSLYLCNTLILYMVPS
jgi:hypothetical protein